MKIRMLADLRLGTRKLGAKIVTTQNAGAGCLQMPQLFQDPAALLETEWFLKKAQTSLSGTFNARWTIFLEATV